MRRLFDGSGLMETVFDPRQARQPVARFIDLVLRIPRKGIPALVLV